MLEIEIPGFGKLELEYLICDFTGTLSVYGRLLPGVNELLDELSTSLAIHVLTLIPLAGYMRNWPGVPAR